MTNPHTFDGFADEVRATIVKHSASSKITRTSRTSRTVCEKALGRRDYFGPSPTREVVRLENNSDQVDPNFSTAKSEHNQPLSDAGPSGPSGPTHFRRGPEAPAEWHAILAELERYNPVDWLPPDRWSAMLLDAEHFLARWGSVADRLGWTALDLFGVHPSAPGGRIGCWGLLLLIQGGEVLALSEDAAAIRMTSNATLTFRRADLAGVVLLPEVAR